MSRDPSLGTPDHNSLIPSNRSTSYPRALLLGIYTAAIEQGFVWVNDVPQADFTSLKMQLLRLRRRSDSSNKSFITPQHHLCTIGDWEPGPDGRGRFPVMFDKLPDGRRTPTLSDMHGNPVQLAAPPPPTLAAPQDVPLPAPQSLPLTAEDMQLDTQGIDDYVAQMMRNVSDGKEPH